MALNLKDFYNRIIKNKIPYCMVCLRTQKERFLTDVKRYNIFAQHCIPLRAQQSFYNHDNGGLVCRTCDGWLRRGLQVMNAVVDSKNANYYFSLLSNGQEAKPPILRHMESTRRNWNLNATETLVISSDMNSPPVANAEPQSTVTVTHEKDCVVIIEHDITNAPALVQRNEVHSVVTLDDSDEESKNPLRRIAPKELEIPSTLVDNGLSITPVPPTTLGDPNIIAPQSLIIPVMNFLCPTGPAMANTPSLSMPFSMSDNTNYPQQPFMISGIPALMTVNNCDTTTITGDISYDKSVIEIHGIQQPEKLNGYISDVCSQADNTNGDVLTDSQNRTRLFNILTRKRGKLKTHPSDDGPGERISTENAGVENNSQVSPSPEESETDKRSNGNCSKRKVGSELAEKCYRFNSKARTIEVSESSSPRSFVQVPKEIPDMTVKQNVDWEDEIPMDVIAYHGELPVSFQGPNLKLPSS